jgi:uncharacterized protein YjeT (DUF2065 family)
MKSCATINENVRTIGLGLITIGLIAYYTFFLI